MSSTRQLVLDFGGPSQGSLDDFWPTSNEQLLARLQALAGGDGSAFLVLWGESGAGKSHLLHGLCDAAGQRGQSAILVDGQQQQHLHPAMLEGLAEVDLVCIDDLQCFAGNPEWEEALFHLYNQVQQAGSSWVVTLDAAPLHSAFRLADLKSRLCACETYRVASLDDPAKRDWLRHAARRRGFELEREWCDYIMHRASRDLPSLLAVIDALDKASLTEQRAMTQPFIRQVMGW